MSEENTPYVCHVFICTNDRQGERRSCADADGRQIREILKTQVAERGWKPKVRVSQSGCLGLCARGPNVMIYPQGIWYSGVTVEGCKEILERIEALLS